MAFISLKKTDIVSFLEMSGTIPVVDVRSPSEFFAGHIPGAVNIPLFDDREREKVGITYKTAGRAEAVIKGLELSGPSMHLKLEMAKRTARGGHLLVHCWRGGMRSEAMAWLFALADIKAEVLEGGYKSYRHHILSSLSEKRRVIVLGGMTGSSKTHILKKIKELNNQVIDLEDIANHKGSAFGSLGQSPQPTSEHFANLLYDQWKSMDQNRPLWLEDESRNIGTVFMPDMFYNNMQEAPTIVLVLEREKRLPRLIREYAQYPHEILKESILRIRKRLGGDNTAEALKAVDSGDIAKAVEITLRYYDKAYMYGIASKKPENTIYIEAEADNIEENALKVIEASGKIKW